VISAAAAAGNDRPRRHVRGYHGRAAIEERPITRPKGAGDRIRTDDFSLAISPRAWASGTLRNDEVITTDVDQLIRV